MVEEERKCIDVMTQISAAQAALDKITLGLLDGHTLTCPLGPGEGPDDPEAKTEELMGAVGQLFRR